MEIDLKTDSRKVKPGDLASKSEDDMIKVRNLGKKSLKEVKEKLIELGLGFKPID